MATNIYLVDSKGVAHPQTKQVHAARYEERSHPYAKYPGAQIWAVSTGDGVKANDGGSFRIWVDPGYYRKLQKQASPVITSHLLLSSHMFSTKGGFCEGRPIVSLDLTIPTCLGASRPQTLWRVVHKEHRSGGTIARGFGKVKTAPLTFQVHFQKHLNWNCRDPSPFMSSTNDFDKAIRICACYEVRGMSGIEILKVDTTGEGWSVETPIWNVRELLYLFNLRILQRRGYLKNEFLIENYIPLSQVTQRISWDEMKDRIDPHMVKRDAANRDFKRIAQKKKRKEAIVGVRSKRTRRFEYLRQA
ncbi:hypothetical protein SLS53_008721 [Cytospora paraplurivora]|uniref:DUF7587 domain-containing protein n=1 Tax=Cytospora paraplurivora TaxID=2898453 RepID=A0AAN9YCR6_9PEZI